jgi:hypothetical protein
MDEYTLFLPSNRGFPLTVACSPASVTLELERFSGLNSKYLPPLYSEREQTAEQYRTPVHMNCFFRLFHGV